MKKILFFIITLFISFNVYALSDDDEECKTFLYTVTIDGEVYSAKVSYRNNTWLNDDDTDKYELDNSTVSLTKLNDDGSTSIRYSNYNADLDPTLSSTTNIRSMPSYVFDKEEIPYSCFGRTSFSLEEIDDFDFMKNYLPKFIKTNGAFIGNEGNSYAFVYYIADESIHTIEEANKNTSNETFFTSSEELNSAKEKFFEDWTEYVNENNPGTSYDNMKIQSDFEYINNSTDTWNNPSLSFNPNDLQDYYKYAKSLSDLLKKAYDVKICTEEDLNKLKALGGSFNNLGLYYKSLLLSNSCYNVLFGDNGLYSGIVTASSYIYSKGSNTINDETHYKMSYLFYESVYYEGIAFLTGNVMQVDTNEVKKCAWFGDETTELFQHAFDVLKYIGVIMGTLLGVVDIFKIVVSKDVDGKKNLKILSKRIILIIALILTPVIVEILFDFVNTFGIDDPLCGIR